MSKPLTLTEAECSALLERINARCMAEGDCLLWQGAMSSEDVPVMHVAGATRTLRRVVWQLVHGEPPPPGRLVVARCRDKRCLSQGCLRCMRRKDMARMDAKRGVYSRADAVTARTLAARRRSRFTAEQVRQVREHPGPAEQAAAAVGMSAVHATNIRAGRARRPLVNNIWAGLMP